MTHETIMRHIVVLVALDAEAHLQLLLQHDPVHMWNVAVAAAAIDLAVDVH
jgi:hypothetical protein